MRTFVLVVVVALVTAACSTQVSKPPAAVPAPIGATVAIQTSITPPAPAAAVDAVDVVRRADDLPAQITRQAAERVVVRLETKEVTGVLADGTTYKYWTFGGKLPGPMIRVRAGDTVELHLKNDPASSQVHSIDLHAVNGPGGGAVATQVAPGEEKVFTFTALNPGVYVYHCATPHIPSHIAQGMYGLIVVEPEQGLSKVDREFYVMQGEIYTAGERGQKGHLDFDGDRMFREQPNFVVFNGKALGLTGDAAMKARAGQRIRIWIGNGGPNLISNFHVIGEVFDVVHNEGASEPSRNVQTTLIPAGGAAWVEFTLDVPGRYILVDHAISRSIDKGAIAFLEVEGAPNPAVFDAKEAVGAGH